MPRPTVPSPPRKPTTKSYCNFALRKPEGLDVHTHVTYLQFDSHRVVGMDSNSDIHVYTSQVDLDLQLLSTRITCIHSTSRFAYYVCACLLQLTLLCTDAAKRLHSVPNM